MSELLSCDSVSRIYRTNQETIHALMPVTLSISPGSTCAIIGPSGSGKSTLLGLLAGLDRPTTGEITYCGRAYTTMSRLEMLNHRRQNVGFLFQSGNLLPGMTVWENVALPLWLNNWPEKAVNSRVKELLSCLAVGHLAKRSPARISSGERQRIALARAVAHRPKLILADEPTGSLDRDAARKASDLLFHLAQENACAVAVATHDSTLADRAQKVIDLRKEGLSR